MGFFDKITKEAKKLGEKLTSEETKEALKTGVAKASSGLAAGFGKLSEKISDSGKVQPQDLTYTEILDILCCDSNPQSRWAMGYASAARLNLATEYPAVHYLIEALGLWRNVKTDEPFNPALAHYVEKALCEIDRMQANVTEDYEGPQDIFAVLTKDVPDMLEAVLSMVFDFEEKTLLDCYYLARAHMSGYATYEDYGIVYNAIVVAEDLLETEQSAYTDIIRSGLIRMQAVYDQALKDFELALSTLTNDNSTEREWQLATEVMLNLIGVDTLRTAGHLIMHYRDMLEDTGLNLDRMYYATAFLRWCEPQPFGPYVVDAHNRMAVAAPGYYADLIERAKELWSRWNELDEDDERTANNAAVFLAAAYLYGWGVPVDLDEATNWATELITLGDDEYSDIADPIFEEIEKARQA